MEGPLPKASCLLSGQAGWSEACGLAPASLPSALAIEYMLGIVQCINTMCKHESLPYLLTLGSYFPGSGCWGGARDHTSQVILGIKLQPLAKRS